MNSHCSEVVEQTVKCQPHYLSREFMAVFVMAVKSRRVLMLKELHNNISLLQSKHPEALYVVAGNFNQVNLTDTLPSFY